MKSANPIKQYSIAMLLGLGMVLGVSTLQAAWTAPPDPPPTQNIAAPLNVGLNTQSKLGQLFINTDTAAPYALGLRVFGQAEFEGKVVAKNGLQMTQNAGDSKFLRSDSTGNASWQYLPPASVPIKWVAFNGIGCTGGAGVNECEIQQASGISTVIRMSQGIYKVIFDEPYNTPWYAMSGSSQYSNTAPNERQSYIGYGNCVETNTYGQCKSPRDEFHVYIQNTGVDSADGHKQDSKYISVMVIGE